MRPFFARNLIRLFLLIPTFIISNLALSQNAPEAPIKLPRNLGLAPSDKTCAANLVSITQRMAMMKRGMSSAMGTAIERMQSFMNGPAANRRARMAREQREIRAQELNAAIPFLSTPGLQRSFRRALDSDLNLRSTKLKRRLTNARNSSKLDNEAQVYDIVNIGAGPHDLVATATYSEVNPTIKTLSITADTEYASTFNTEGFRLNSPSRAGLDGRPAAPGVDDLNKLPNSILQVPMISGDRYPTAQSLSDVSTVNRYVYEAPVLFNTRVEAIDDKFQARASNFSNSRGLKPEDWPARYRIQMNDGTYVFANAINEVAGLGRDPNLSFLNTRTQSSLSRAIDVVDETIARGQPAPSDQRIFTGRSFFRWSDDYARNRAELSGRRVAVIGGGDTSNTVNEALFGLGTGNLGQAAQDGQVARVDWIGQKNADCKSFIENTRSRYGGLVNPIKSGALQATPLQLNGVSYNSFGGPFNIFLAGRVPVKTNAKARAEIYNTKEVTQITNKEAASLAETLNMNDFLYRSISQTDDGALLQSAFQFTTGYQFFRSKDLNGNPVLIVRSEVEKLNPNFGLNDKGDERIFSTREVDALIFGTGFNKDDSIYKNMSATPSFKPVAGSIEKPEGTKAVSLGTRLESGRSDIPEHQIYRSGPGAGPELIPDDETASAGKKGKQRVKANKVSLFNWTPRTEAQARLIAEQATLNSISNNGANSVGRHFDEAKLTDTPPVAQVLSTSTPGNFSFRVGDTRTYRGQRIDLTGDALFMEASVSSKLYEFDLSALAKKDLEIRLTRDGLNSKFSIATEPPLDSQTLASLQNSFADDIAFHDGLLRNMSGADDNVFLYKAEISDNGKIVDARVDVLPLSKVNVKTDDVAALNNSLKKLNEISPSNETYFTNANALSLAKQKEFRIELFQSIEANCRVRNFRAQSKDLVKLLLRGISDKDPDVRKAAIKAFDQSSNVLYKSGTPLSGAPLVEDLAYKALRSKYPEVRDAGLSFANIQGIDSRIGALGYYSRRAFRPVDRIYDRVFDREPLNLVYAGVVGAIISGGIAVPLLMANIYSGEESPKEQRKKFPEQLAKYKQENPAGTEYIAYKDSMGKFRLLSRKPDSTTFFDSYGKFDKLSKEDFSKVGIMTLDSEEEYRKYEKLLYEKSKKENALKLLRSYVPATAKNAHNEYFAVKDKDGSISIYKRSVLEPNGKNSYVGFLNGGDQY